MIQQFLQSDIANITFFVQYYALLKSIISFKGKDYNTFSDGNNHIFSHLILSLYIIGTVYLHCKEEEADNNQLLTPYTIIIHVVPLKA